MHGYMVQRFTSNLIPIEEYLSIVQGLLALAENSMHFKPPSSDGYAILQHDC